MKRDSIIGSPHMACVGKGRDMMRGSSNSVPDGSEINISSSDIVNPTNDGTSTSSNKKNPIALDRYRRMSSKGMSIPNSFSERDSSSTKIVSRNIVNVSCQLYDGSAGSLSLGSGTPNQ